MQNLCRSFFRNIALFSWVGLTVLLSIVPIHGHDVGRAGAFEVVETLLIRSEAELSARIGVSLYSVESEAEIWSFNGNSRFPLMSTFKTLAGACLLLEAEAHDDLLGRKVLIDEDSVIAWSPILNDYVGAEVSLDLCLSAMMTMSDNTAANVILRAIGGPSKVTDFMAMLGDDVTRLDRVEPELNEAQIGDIRDTTAPSAVTRSLATLLYGSVLSPKSKQHLMGLMVGNKVSDGLLRSVLPKGWSIADRSGAGGHGSRGITAVVWSESMEPIAIAIYITESDLDLKERDELIVKVAQRIFSIFVCNGA